MVLISLPSTFLFWILTFGFSAAHWLCDTVPCPTPSSYVYGRGTLEFNCFPNYEEHSLSMFRCSSYCSLKECAMISFDECEYIIPALIWHLYNKWVYMKIITDTVTRTRKTRKTRKITDTLTRKREVTRGFHVTILAPYKE